MGLPEKPCSSMYYSPPSAPGNWSFYCLRSFVFSRMLCTWNHTAFSNWLLLLSNVHLRFLHVFLQFGSLFTPFFVCVCVCVCGRAGVWTLGFELPKQAFYCFNHTSSSFCSDYLGDGGVSWTICPGCPPTTSLLISASQVVRITALSHLQPSEDIF
jgi:hypothetical protein